jgi:MFS family permease
MDPNLSIQLTSPPHNMKDAKSGLGFTLWALTCALFSPIVGILCQYIDRRAIISAGILIQAISLFLVGPSSLLFPNEQTYLMFIGLGILGASNSMACVPNIPELVESVQEEINKKRITEGGNP